ncbi:MAG: AtpZ/AtpI family protein [Thiomonas sp.]|uniref:Putative ATP synthase gene 1 n=1 Tax=mine drainage metagenome TaxID=410659 RepID=E6PS90_9ZZZZ
MSDTPSRPEDSDDALVRQASLRSARHRRWLREGEPSVARRLAQIGVLGWIIVLPMLLGLFAGRWLDRALGTGLMFTGALLILGLALGSWSAWKWMKSA